MNIFVILSLVCGFLLFQLFTVASLVKSAAESDFQMPHFQRALIMSN